MTEMNNEVETKKVTSENGQGRKPSFKDKKFDRKDRPTRREDSEFEKKVVSVRLALISGSTVEALTIVTPFVSSII